MEAKIRAQPEETAVADQLRIEAIVFDLDGTLIDSAPDIQTAINEVLAEDGLASVPLPIVTSFIGHGVGKLVERAYRHHSIPVSSADLAVRTARFSAAYGRLGTVRTKVFPGVVDGLSMLRAQGIKLGVCTNKPRALSEQILNELCLRSFFDVLIGGDSCATRKPNPEPLWTCVNDLHINITRTLYVGDSETDVATARAAGIPVVLVTYGYATTSVARLGADDSIHRIHQLVGCLRSMSIGHGTTG